jgi:hypothetical protein
MPAEAQAHPAKVCTDSSAHAYTNKMDVQVHRLGPGKADCQVKDSARYITQKGQQKRSNKPG